MTVGKTLKNAEVLLQHTVLWRTLCPVADRKCNFFCR